MLLLLLLLTHGAETRKIIYDDSDDAKAEAQQILSFMNQSVSPCEDFYEFACGSYKSPHDTFKSWNNVTYDRLLRMVNNIKDSDAKYKRDIRSAFRSCMANKPVTNEDVRKYILELGGWPLVDKDTKKQSWSSLAGQIRSQYMIDTLLSFDFQLEDKVPVAITTSKLTVNVKGRTDLKANMKNLLKTLYPDKCICMPDIEAGTQKVVDFAVALESLIKQTNESDHSYFNPVDFARRFPEFQLQSFMTAFISAEAWSQFQSRMTISLPYSKSTIAAISTLLKDTDEDTIVNYIVYKFATALQLTVDVTDANDWEKCLRKTSKNKQLGSAFVSAFFNDNFNLSIPDQFHVERLQADMADIDVLLRQAYVKMISRSPWLPPAAKVKLNKMLLRLKHHLMMPTWPEQQLDEYYNLLNINESEPTTVVSRKIGAFNNWHEVATFLADGTTPDDIASRPPLDMNARYAGPYYLIYTGFVQAPLYSSYRMPTSAKFGVFTVAGHEIGHSVDYHFIRTTGGDFTPEMENAINANHECFQDTYAYLGNVTIKIRGEYFTLPWPDAFRFIATQIVADVSGLRATYLAFKAWQEKNSPGVDHRLRGLKKYSGEQIMYIKYVQNWCSTESKINPGGMYVRPTVTVNNDVEFPNLFGCKKRKRCDYLI